MTDEEIRSFFHDNRPSLQDGASFMAGLKARMDAVSEIKRIQEASVRRNRTILLATFIAGLALGAAAMVFLFVRPVPAPQMNAVLLSQMAAFVNDWKSVFFAVIAAAAIAFSLVSARRSGLWA